MVFSSMVFLWIFLPVSLVGGFVFQKIRLQNLFLLLMSLLFYAWGEPHYLILLLLSIGMNWAFGLWMEKAPFHKKFVLVLSVLCNLALLGYYKYADFILNTLDAFLPGADLPRLHLPLPIGISFFTFQAMSYVIDLYRGEYRAEKSLLDLALYISFFPQLIAGPIVKYRDIHEEIHNRQTVSLANLSTGARRFIYGLGKKVILSNLIASCATTFLSADQTQTSSLMAWTGVILYALQIYYDFSGYSDMAIGLGRMFGFHILENFNLPYISGSIQEFWRRWHMSLSGWFKEYLYIPLGGNRKGELRTCINLLIVFATTGLWHGASWNFVCWGLWHGVFIVIERLGFSKFLKKHRVFGHAYALLVEVTGWSFFAVDSAKKALHLLGVMFRPFLFFHTPRIFYTSMTPQVCLVFGLAVCGSGLIQVLFSGQKTEWIARKWKNSALEWIYLSFIALYAVMLLANHTYNPFIYFRF